MDCSLPRSSVHEILHAEYWSGLLFPSPGDLPDSGIKARSPELQADSLPSELPGKAPTSLRNHTVSISLIKIAFSDGHLVTRGPRNGEQPGSGRSTDGKSFGWMPGPRARHSQYTTLKGGQQHWSIPLGVTLRREVIPSGSVRPGGSAGV